MKIRVKLVAWLVCICMMWSHVLVPEAAQADIVHAERYQECEIEYGIDVSKWNGTIDWNKVKKDGIDYAIIRVGNRYSASGLLAKDEKALEYMNGAQAAGIPIGVYVYSQAITTAEAVEEAKLALEMVAGYQIDLPIVMDFEYYSGTSGESGRLYDANLSKTQATKICLAFCEYVEQAGYTPMVYANASMLTNQLNASEISEHYQIWLAHYANKTTYEGAYSYWQYTSSGTVQGITGSVDLNVRYLPVEDKVTGLTITEHGKDSITIQWNQSETATGYEVYRQKGTGAFEQIADITDGSIHSYEDKKLQLNTIYTYQVKAYEESETGRVYLDESDTVSGKTAPGKVANVSGTGKSFDSIKVSWKKISGVSGYVVQRYDATKKSYQTVQVIVGDNVTSYTDTGLHASTKYKYRIYAYHALDGGQLAGDYSDKITVKTKGTATGKVLTQGLNFRKGAGTSYKSLTTLNKGQTITLTGSSGNWYRAKTTVKGKTVEGYVYQDYVKEIKVGTVALSGKVVSFSQNKLTWKQVSGAAGYQIQRYDKTKKSYVTIKTITKGGTLSYKDTDLNASTTYQYRVRAYKNVSGKKVYGAFSEVKSIQTKQAVTGKVTASSVNVRKAASVSSKALGQLSKNKKVTVKGSKGNWYRISVTIKGKSVTGYISKEFVKI